MQKRKTKPSTFDILKVNEKIPFKFDYFAGERGRLDRFFILKARLLLKERYAKSEG